MLKKLMKTAVVTATVMALGSTGAFADDGKAKINEYVYDVESAETAFLHVTSSDGTKWDNLKSGMLPFSAHMKIDTKWPGAVIDVAVVLGNCSGNYCKSFPILWGGGVGKRDYDKHRVFSVHTSLIANATPAVALVGQNIIETCNQHLASDGATKKHEFQSSLPTTFIADTDKSDLAAVDPAEAQIPPYYAYPHNIDHAKSGDFTFKVVCDPYIPSTTVGGLQMEEGEFQTTGIDLFLSTFATETTQPNPATTCKKGRILVRVNTSKAGPAKFKLWTRVGNGPFTSKVVDAWSSFDGNSGFKAEHTEWVSVSEPTQVQAMAEDMVNSFVGQTTQWKDIMLQCTGTGGGGKGGGLTVEHDEPLLPGLKLTGDFSYVDVGSPECSRTGKALISFKSNRPDNIHYSLDCTNGQHLSGYVKPEQVPQGGFVAAAMQTFQIDKTTVYSCALKTVQPGPVKLHQWKGHTFQCVTRTEGVTGTDGGLTVGQDEPVLPERELTGDFSYVDVGSPKCSRTGKALISFKSNRADDVHYNLDCTNGQKFTGVAKMESNQQGGYVAAAMQPFEIDKTTVYSCALKTAQPGPAKLHQWKGHTFQCVHRAVETGPNDVQVDPKPTDDAPRTPAADVKTAPKPTDVDADKKRQEALEKAREAARKKAEAEKKAAEEARRKRAEAEKKAAEEARRKKAEAANKAAQKAAEEARRKKAEAAKKAAQKAAEEARRKKAEAAKKAAQKAAEEARRKKAEAAKKAAQKAAEEARRKKAEAAKKQRKSNTGNGNAATQILRQR